MMFVRASIACVALVGCINPGPELEKAEVRGGKADSSDACLAIGAEPGCDVCLEMDWYGDGVCDQGLIEQGACHGPDQDCDLDGCFETHLVEAIHLNEERAERYAALTDGASRAVSRTLIASEKVTRFVAARFDRRAIPWQQHGVSIMCDEMVPMDLAPAFRASGPIPTTEFRKRGSFLLAAKLAAELTFGGFGAIARELEQELAELQATPDYHCMLRHILESMLRAANLAAQHEADARALGLESPHKLSRDFIPLAHRGPRYRDLHRQEGCADSGPRHPDRVSGRAADRALLSAAYRPVTRAWPSLRSRHHLAPIDTVEADPDPAAGADVLGTEESIAVSRDQGLLGAVG